MRSKPVKDAGVICSTWMSSMLTGGQAYFPGASKDLDGVFDKIREELAARYSLGYLSTDTRANGAWRGVEIKLVRSDLKGVKLRTRSGYFAPYKEAR